jgi:hypothetical protein
LTATTFWPGHSRSQHPTVSSEYIAPLPLFSCLPLTLASNRPEIDNGSGRTAEQCCIAGCRRLSLSSQRVKALEKNGRRAGPGSGQAGEPRVNMPIDAHFYEFIFISEFFFSFFFFSFFLNRSPLFVNILAVCSP